MSAAEDRSSGRDREAPAPPPPARGTNPPTEARALTLYPEHAEMFRLGLRSIETRAKPTRWRGRLLLHAGMRDPDCRAARESPRSQAALAAIPHGQPLTRGAVVASCVLSDCVPIKDVFSWLSLHAEGSFISCAPGGLTLYRADDPATHRDITAEEPFGIYSEGRFAWLLSDVKPTTEPIPCRGHQGLWVPPPEVVERVTW